MRVTKAKKEETRKRILAVARKIFLARGFEETTTRMISKKTGIATGTLFNYFKTKEAIALALVHEGLERGRAAFARQIYGDEDLDELLFAHVATGLRQLDALRPLLQPVLEGTLTPQNDDAAAQLREGHLAVVRQQLHGHGWDDAANEVTLHMYWALYIGVVTFWARDTSEKREQSLALLDKSMKLFVDSLSIFGGLP